MSGPRMKRRTFIAGLGGAVACPLVARAQQPERMRRIGMPDIYPLSSRLSAFAGRGHVVLHPRPQWAIPDSCSAATRGQPVTQFPCGCPRDRLPNPREG
jgi:hypothetical protein